MNKHYVILGKGYVGTEIFNLFKKTGRSVDFFSKTEFDYTNPLLLSKFLQFSAASQEVTVINCAGFTGHPNVDACEAPYNKEKVFALNVLLPLNLANICKSIKNVNLIHISSGCIFNGYTKVYDETDSPDFGFYSNESSFYSKTKHLSEIMLNQLNYGVILRIRMIFGKDSSDRNFLTKIKKYSHLFVKENSMTCLHDLANFVLKFTEENLERKHDTYNVVNEGSVSLKIVTAIFNRFERHKKDWLYVEESDLKLAAKRSNCVLNSKKIRDLNLQLPSCVESLEKCIENM